MPCSSDSSEPALVRTLSTSGRDRGAQLVDQAVQVVLARCRRGRRIADGGLLHLRHVAGRVGLGLLAGLAGGLGGVVARALGLRQRVGAFLLGAAAWRRR